MLNGILKLSILFILLLAGYTTASASFTISRPSTNNLGLVGHWTFDGGKVVNGVALDSTTNANNGNLVNIATSTFYASGKIGQGFNFDGTDDGVNAGSAASLDDINIKTISAWIKLDSFGENSGGRIVDKENSNSDGWNLFVNNNVSFNLQSIAYLHHGGGSNYGVWSSPINSILVGNWYHVTIVYDRTSYTNDPLFYINGALVATTENTSPPVGAMDDDNLRSVFIGNNNTAGIRSFDGIIDDVRIYNRILSAGEVKNLYNQGESKFNKTPTNILTSGLVGHWTFDGKNVVNGVALDSAANANNGNLVSIATSTFYSAGKIGQGFNFDGVDDGVNAGSAASLDDINTKTISAWIKLDSFGETSTGRIVDKENANSDGWNFFVNNTASANLQSIAYLHHGVGSYGIWSSPTNSILVGNWYHVTIVYDRTSYTNDPLFYINGVLVATTENQAPPVGAMDDDNLRSVFIGNVNAAGTRSFDGNIDDVRVYNRALSTTEVKMLYNMGR